MTLFEQIKDFVSLGWKIEFSHEPVNMTIKVTFSGVEKEAFLPAHHCNEENMTMSITLMIDEILKEI